MKPARDRGDPPAGPIEVDGDSGAGLLGLPQPLHLLEYAFGTGHYHLGLFDATDEAIGMAQDRTSALAADGLADASRVLDIGCGLGGTTRLLSRRAGSVTGLEPASSVVRFARGAGGPASESRRISYVLATLREFAAGSSVRFTGAVAIEVLQHFPSLDEFFADCAALLVNGARLAVHDVCSDVDVAWERVPFHRRGEVPARAAAAGFAMIRHKDESTRVLPTFTRFASGLDARRSRLIEFFGRVGDTSRSVVTSQLEALLGHIDALRRAFHCGDLGYETMVFERR